jgi:excisionase family DNA binding protein
MPRCSMEIPGAHPQAVDGVAESAPPVARDGAGEDNLHELLTVEDVAALLRVSRSWVYEHTRSRGTRRSDRLPYIKVGKYLRFEARAIRAFIEKQCRRT